MKKNYEDQLTDLSPLLKKRIKVDKLIKQVDDFENDIQNEVLNSLRRFGKIMLTIIPVIAAIPLFKINSIAAIAFLSVSGASSLIFITRNVVNSKNNTTTNFNMDVINDELSEYETELFKNAKKEYYYEPISKKQKLLNKLEQENHRKYVEGRIFSKIDINNELVALVDYYYYCYQLPQYTVNDEYWNKFIDLTYTYYENNNLIDSYFDDFCDALKEVLADILVYQKESFGNEQLLSTLSYISNSKIPLDKKNNIVEYMKNCNFSVRNNKKSVGSNIVQFSNSNYDDSVSNKNESVGIDSESASNNNIIEFRRKKR